MHLTSIQVTSHLHAGPENCISCPSRSNLKPIQVSLCVSYFHSCPASPASMSLVLGGTEMLFWNFDRSDSSPGWGWVEIIETWRDINVSHPSRSQLISVQVSLYASHLHPGHVSPSCGSRKLHLVSIQVQSETHPGIIMRVLLPFMPCLTCIHVPPPPPPPPLHAPFHIHPCPKILQFMLQPGHDVGISHPFHVSHPSRSRELLLSSILVPPLHIQVSRCVSQPNPGHNALPRLNICIPSPPRTRLTQFR